MNHDDRTQLNDAYWAALVADLMHPVQVAIIEAFGWLGQPLTVRELTEIVIDVEPIHLDYHMGRLRRLGVLDCKVTRAGTDFMDVSYRLAEKRGRRGLW
jgi:DNA-binding transcriptional ArsR family regulator